MRTALSKLVLIYLLAFATQQSARSAEYSIDVDSPSFADGTKIPKQFTIEGINISPAIEWKGVPPGTVSLALICEDPDAPRGTWIHWVLFNIPPTQTMLPQGYKAPGQEGTNSFRKRGYGGPEPPPGKLHHYYFKIFALDKDVQLPAGASSNELERAMAGHVLAKGKLMGTYKR